MKKYNVADLTSCKYKSAECLVDFPEHFSDIMMISVGDDVAANLGLYQVVSDCPVCCESTAKCTSHLWTSSTEYDWGEKQRHLFSLMICESCENMMVVKCFDYDDDRDYFFQYDSVMFFNKNWQKPEDIQEFIARIASSLDSNTSGLSTIKEFDNHELSSCESRDVFEDACYEPYSGWQAMKVALRDSEQYDLMGLLKIKAPCPHCYEATHQQAYHAWVITHSEYEITYLSLLNCEKCGKSSLAKSFEYCEGSEQIFVSFGQIWFSPSWLGQSTIQKITSELALQFDVPIGPF